MSIRSTLIESLIDQGWSPASAEALVTESIAAAEAERRARQAIERVAAVPYQEWLQTVSPEMIWDQPFHGVIASQIDRVLAGNLTKLMLSLPPRAGKSESVTIRLPVRFLEQFPEKRVIVAAYNRDLAKTFTGQSLALYRRRHPEMVEREAEDEWSNKAGGSVRAVGVGSGVTGHGGDLIIIDDPVKGYEEATSPAYQDRLWQWWINDMRTRRNDMERTPVIIIQTRWTELDLTGRILDGSDGKNWLVLNFPAIAEDEDILGRKRGESIWQDRMPIAELEALREDMGLRFEALYQGQPTPVEGALFKSEWFRYGDVPGVLVAKVRFWDLAESAVNKKNQDPDWTAGAAMSLYLDGEVYRYHIDHVAAIRAEPGDRDQFVLRTAIADKELYDVHIQAFEETSKSVTHGMRLMLTPQGIQVDGIRSARDKVTRTVNLRADMQMGRVAFGIGSWVRDTQREMLRFPGGSHDDQVDAVAGAHSWLTMHSLIFKRR